MYTRWLQAGAFSGTMRSHERGMSAGGCGNSAGVTPAAYAPTSGTCSLIAPWNVGPKFVEANRGALQVHIHAVWPGSNRQSDSQANRGALQVRIHAVWPESTDEYSSQVR